MVLSCAEHVAITSHESKDQNTHLATILDENFCGGGKHLSARLAGRVGRVPIVMEVLSLARVLVTGVAGFIGSRIAGALVGRGHRVFGVDNLSDGNLDAVPNDCEFEILDLADTEALATLPRSCDAVLHLAGQASGEKSFHHPHVDLDSNIRTTINLLDYSRAVGVRKFLYASTMGVYGDCPSVVAKETSAIRPLSPYGISKLAAEQHVRINRRYFDCTSLRMFNVYGPGQRLGEERQGMLRIYVGQAMSRKKIVVKGSLTRVRDFIHIRDIEDVWVRALETTRELPESLNAGTGTATSVSKVLEILVGLLPGTAVEVRENTPGDQSGIVADTSQLFRALGDFQFVDLESGLREYVDWAKGQ